MFQVLIGILTIVYIIWSCILWYWFQVLIGILTIYSIVYFTRTLKRVSSPYRYSNNLPLRVIMTPAFVFQVLIGILTIVYIIWSCILWYWFQVLIGILTINECGIYIISGIKFQVLIGILTIHHRIAVVCLQAQFQVLIGILTIDLLNRVSSPYRYSNNEIDCIFEFVWYFSFKSL